jgi:hypothetical protein
VYSAFLAAGDEYEDALYEIAATDPPDPWQIDRSRLDPAYARLRSASTELTLFASDEVGRSASEYLQLLVPAFATLHEGHTFGPYGWAPVNLSVTDGHPNDQFGTPRSHFVLAARREVGLPTPMIWNGLPPSLGVRSPGRKGQSSDA